MPRVQSVLLYRTQFSRKAARAWIEEHGFTITPKHHATSRFWHFPQGLNAEGRYKTRFKHFPHGLKMLLFKIGG